MVIIIVIIALIVLIGLMRSKKKVQKADLTKKELEIQKLKRELEEKR